MPKTSLQSVSVTSPDLGQDISSLRISLGINTIPIMELGLQPLSSAKDPVRPVITAEEATRMGAVQTECFNRSDDSLKQIDVTLEVDGTNPQSYSWFGAPIAPTKSLGFGFVDHKIQLYGRELFLNALRPYIYAPLPVGSNAKLQDADSSEEVSDGRIMARLVRLLKARMDAFEKTTNLSPFNNPELFVMTRQIHAVNQDRLPALEDIAANSPSALYRSFQHVAQLGEVEQRFINRSINATLENTLLQASGGFFDAFVSLLTAFQMYYVPAIGGSTSGSVKPFRSMVRDDVETKSVDPQYLSFISANTDYGPIQQVLVQGVMQSNISNAENSSSSSQTVTPDLTANTLLSWPESIQVLNGNFRPVGPPLWMPDNISVFEKYVDSKVESSGGWDIVKYNAEVTAMRDAKQRVLKGPYLDILKEYADNIYCQTALAPYSAVIKAPLDFSWEVGKRYEIKDIETGEVLFRGFLGQLTHNISGIRNSLSADTTLIFSHAEYGFFRLPS